jgi:hypothetical protein
MLAPAFSFILKKRGFDSPYLPIKVIPTHLLCLASISYYHNSDQIHIFQDVPAIKTLLLTYANNVLLRKPEKLIPRNFLFRH